MGNLGRDPELKYVSQNHPVARFSLATSEIYTDREGASREAVEWHQIAAWRELAEWASAHLSKGALVYIEGKLRTSSWEDKRGTIHKQTEVVADNIRILSMPQQYPEKAESMRISTDFPETPKQPLINAQEELNLSIDELLPF